MVRTRFAPSPTGFLHIGGVRTALFNWLYARACGGEFILRIDDTDEDRNLQEALGPILEGFRWLGIDWDEGPESASRPGPYFQSQRAEFYQAAVEKLIANGAAYYDYASPEEIQAEREAAHAAGRSFRYSRRWMAASEADRAKFQTQGREGVVRLKMPHEGTLILKDLVRGEVKFDWAAEQDHVIQRANGTCLYHLATVVDDEDFKITHVIRAEEHLSNTPRQIFICDALGYERPEFAHLPYVAEPGSKSKLSKRKLKKYLKNPDFAQLYQKGEAIVSRIGQTADVEFFNPVLVDFYRQIGFLPEALLNYLLLLGWSLDDETEMFSQQQMIDLFSLDRVNKAPASFDPAKLLAFQEKWMRQLETEQKVALTLRYLQKANLVEQPPSGADASRLSQLIEAAGDRIKVAGDVLEFTDFFLPDEALVYDEKAFKKRICKAGAAELLGRFAEQLATVSPFDATTCEGALKDFVSQQNIKIGEIIHALRVAVTGKSVGLGMFESLALLGREATLRRIDRALQKYEAEQSKLG